jgi:L-seryl-tRNA(Ser) seleniumtransferase
MTIAALSATLRLLAQGDITRIPVLRMITEPPDAAKERAKKLMGLIKRKGSEVVSTQAVIGGGSAPTKSFPSYGVQMRNARASEVHARLRTCVPAVICRIEEDMLVFDMKAVSAEEIPVLAEKINEVLSK